MKKVLSFLLVLTMLFSFAACSQTGIPEAMIPATAVSEMAVAPSHYPVTVTDQAGSILVLFGLQISCIRIG